MLTYETLLTPGTETHVTPVKRTRRAYKPRSRRCKICRESFTPKSKHGEYCSDKCRKKAWRDRVAKAKQNKSQPVKEALLELLICPTCGQGFFATVGKGQRHCTPSCRTKAWRQRRIATIDILTFDMAISREKAADLLETGGLEKIRVYLNARGYFYDEKERNWVRGFSQETM
jgi:hypothetical protein